jgi:uncharacterized membrane protein
MSEQIQDEKKEDEIKIPFYRYIIIAVIMIITILAFYFYNFSGRELSTIHSDWGTFGDYMGGTLNPLLAFLSLIALLTTIQIQSKELRATTTEMSNSSAALQEQSQSIKLQNFENTFFKMIDVHNSIIFDLALDKFKDAQTYSNNTLYYVDFLMEKIRFRENEDVKEKETIKRLLDILTAYNKKSKKDYKDNYDKFHNHYEDKIGHYFGFIYQVLIFIRDAEENKQIENSKKYAHLYRSLFSKSELALLAHHCLGSIGKEKFKGLVEDFEFFEHLPTNSLDDDLVLMYDKSVFGKSDKWKNHVEKISGI